MDIVNHSPDAHPRCGVCKSYSKAPLVFRYHADGEDSYYFCADCQDVPNHASWRENWEFAIVEPEKPQIILV